MVGLDNAGKKSILRVLGHRTGDAFSHISPIIWFLATAIPTNEFPPNGGAPDTSLLIHCWDKEGCRRSQRAWDNHWRSHGADGLVFVVDSNDGGLMESARRELHRIANEDETLRSLPILILATKRDLPGAMSLPEVRSRMGLGGWRRNWRLQGVCTKREDVGLVEAFQWLAAGAPRDPSYQIPRLRRLYELGRASIVPSNGGNKGGSMDRLLTSVCELPVEICAIIVSFLEDTGVIIGC